jgi:hypothetical protein
MKGSSDYLFCPKCHVVLSLSECSDGILAHCWNCNTGYKVSLTAIQSDDKELKE